MENLFKKGFVSLALAGVMTSSALAGNAAYVDVKVNYLGGTGKAVLGYEGTKNLDKVELLISVLDKDGEYATKNKDGSADIADLPVVNASSVLDAAGHALRATNIEALDGTLVTAAQNSLELDATRDLEGAKNIERILLDYTDSIATKLSDDITIKTGTGATEIERKITINLGSVDAEGLILRATPNGTINTAIAHINNNFSNINATSEATNLDVESSRAPGGLVGIEIPLQVYASTLANNNSVTGKFTLAPNLEGKTIVITALADYNESNVTNTVLNSIEVEMKNGQATGMIKITNGLSGGIDGAQNINPANDGLFESALTEGLGIAFLAYVKDEQGTNNYPISAPANSNTATLTNTTDLSDYEFDANISHFGANTDTIQVKSGEPTMIIVGEFVPTAKTDAKLWRRTSSTLFVADGNDTSKAADGTFLGLGEINASHELNTTLTVVDMYKNPAVVAAAGISAPSVKFGSDDTNKFVKVTAGDLITDIVTPATSTIQVNVSDSEDTNDTVGIKSVNFTVSASTGVLSAVSAVDLTAKTLPLVENLIDGGSALKTTITDVNTTAAFASSGIIITTANKVKATDVNFQVVIKAGLGDTNTSDYNSTLRFYFKDMSGDNDYLGTSDLNKYRLGFADTNGTFNIGNNNVLTDTTSNVNGESDSDGYKRFDFNTTATASSNDFTIEINSSATVNVANIVFENYNAATIGEEEILIDFKVYEDKKIDAYVETYISEADFSKSEAKPGSIVNFKFSGSAVKAGDKIEIDMNSTGLTTAGGAGGTGRIGLVGSDIASNTDGEIETTLAENMMVSVVLYDVNRTDDAVYGFNSIQVNGINPIHLYLKDNDDTDDIVELNVSDTIKMVRLDESAIVKTKILVGSGQQGTGAGNDDDNEKALPLTGTGALVGPLDTKAKTITGEVLTGIFYDIFTLETDVVFVDMYGNEVEGLKSELKKDVTFTYTDGIEFDNDGTDTVIKFKDTAAGTTQVLTATYTDSGKVFASNTVTFTKIKFNKKNDGLLVTHDFQGAIDPNTGNFDVVNSEVIIKVIGDGNQKQSSTKITLSHSDEKAKFKLVKLADIATNGYDDILSGLDDSIITTVAEDGSYYIVSTDTAGTLTITATSTVKDEKDNDKAISGSTSITFDAIDIDKPVVNKDDVVASNGTISVAVSDKNLNTVKTTVVINDINGKEVAKATYANGKYTATGLNSGKIYTIIVHAADMAGNMYSPDGFARLMGKGVLSAEKQAETTLLAKKEGYTIAGTFSSHKFGDDAAKNWVYVNDEGSYQLLGETPSDASPFGFKKVEDVKVGEDNVWYMVKIGNGRFDWALANKDGVALKLKGAKADGTFDYTGRLNLKVDMTDGKLTFTK